MNSIGNIDSYQSFNRNRQPNTVKGVSETDLKKEPGTSFSESKSESEAASSVIPKDVTVSLSSNADTLASPDVEAGSLYSKSGEFDVAKPKIDGSTLDGRETPDVDADVKDKSEGKPAQSSDDAPAQSDKRIGSTELSRSELQEVEVLKKRDAEVRAHEQAHANVGGSLAGAPTYDYEVGPDGKRYAVGGEVSISVGKVSGDPEATLQKANKVRGAALAPANPSSQDRKVAAQAAMLAQEARREINQQNIEGSQAEADEGVSEAPPASEAEPEITENSGKVEFAIEQAPESESAPQQNEAQIASVLSDETSVEISDDIELVQPAAVSTGINVPEPVALISGAVSTGSANTATATQGAEPATVEAPSAVTTSEGSVEVVQGDGEVSEGRDDLVEAPNRLLVSVTEQNKAIEVFEATQSLYKNIEEQGGISRSDRNSAEPGSLVNTLV